MKKHYDISRLACIAEAPREELFRNPKNFFGPNAELIEEGGFRYIFIDNGGKILAVGHLDTVDDIDWGSSQAWVRYGDAVKELAVSADVEIPNKVTVEHTAMDTIIQSIALDDRLGVWIITEVLPKFGVVADILLTDDEEIGQTTAMHFTTQKEYNWMFEFDRRGYGTVVMYHYHTTNLEKELEKLDYDVQRGTFSDISQLTHLGISGFNFGCGYVDEHTYRCRTRLSWIKVCVEMFLDFYAINKDFSLPYVPVVTPRSYGTGKITSPRGWSWEDEDDFHSFGGTQNWSVNQGKCRHCEESAEYKDELGYICDSCINLACECIWCGQEFIEDELVEGMCTDCRQVCVELYGKYPEELDDDKNPFYQ